MQTKKIKLADILTLFSALSGLSSLRLPFEKAMALAKLRRAVAEIKDTYVQQLNSLAGEYGATIQPNGFLTPPEDSDKRSAFLAELDELINFEAEVEYSPVVLTALDIGGQKISCDELLAAEGFLEFIQEGA